MIEMLNGISGALISVLVTAAVRSLLLAGIAAVGLAISRSRATSVHLFTWRGVLYASLALPILGAFLPPVRVHVPESLGHRMGSIRLERSEIVQSGTGFAIDSRANAKLETVDNYRGLIPASKGKPAAQGAFAGRTSPVRRALGWNVIAAAVYLLLTFFFIARFATAILGSRKLLRQSAPVSDTCIMAMLASRTGGSIPRLVASERIFVPLTIGIVRAAILLPSDWRHWNPEKLKAVVAHELSHVKRHDVLTQSCALVYRAIFWFNPLAWWMNLHLASLAEQASDEAVLSDGTDRANYARTLLDFFEAVRTGPGRIRWQGVSLARAGQAEQRVERILAWKGTVAMNMKKSFAVLILVMAVPIVYLAAAVRPSQVISAPSNADIAQQPRTQLSPPEGPIGSGSSVAPVADVPAEAPTAPVAPIESVAANASMALVRQAEGGHRGFSYHHGFDDEERFVIVSGKSDGFTISGSAQDARHVEKLKKQIPGDFIWFQRDEKSYIIRDQATVDRARGLWAPQEELGRKQQELGKQQEELGKQQAELGNKMQQVRVNVPDMTAQLDRLKTKLQKMGPSATMEQIGELQSEIGELQSKLGSIQSQAGEQQGKLGELQGALGEKQGKLGEQQGELGRQQAELSEKATRQMKELLDEAIKNGTAKSEDELVKSSTL